MQSLNAKSNSIPYFYNVSATLTLFLEASPSACNSTLPNFFKNILAMNTYALSDFLIDTYRLLSYGSNFYFGVCGYYYYYC